MHLLHRRLILEKWHTMHAVGKTKPFHIDTVINMLTNFHREQSPLVIHLASFGFISQSFTQSVTVNIMQLYCK